MSQMKLNRREAIVNLVKIKRQVTILELSKEFGVTEETIRKDLQELSEQGKLLRTFGGAALREYGTERSLDQRNIQNLVEKQKIARAAVGLVREGNMIVMDAGSTTSVFSKMLPSDKEIIVLTNSLEITNILAAQSGISVISTGGRLRTKSMSFQGILAENAIESFNAEKAFISCAAVDVNLGVMDSNEGEARIKQKMIGIAREVYLLADSLKIGGIAHITTCPLNRITGIVTDDSVSSRTVQMLESAGVRVIVGK